MDNRLKTDMVSIKTHGDRTLFFDFLPFDIGQIMGYDLKIMLYTVPGQVKYNATRKLVLRGVDGLVFVADAMEIRREYNTQSLENLHENLKEYNIDISKLPIIMQYNKVDLNDQGIPLLSQETLENDLNSELQAPSFMASALQGRNVIPTLKKIISLTVMNIKKDLQ
jgi:signal recognition particle receptor subunit beta